MLSLSQEIHHCSIERILKYPPLEVAQFSVLLLEKIIQLEEGDSSDHEDCRAKIKEQQKQLDKIKESNEKLGNITITNGKITEIKGGIVGTFVSSLQKNILEKDKGIKFTELQLKTAQDQNSKDISKIEHLEKQVIRLKKSYAKLEDKYQKQRQLVEDPTQPDETILGVPPKKVQFGNVPQRSSLRHKSDKEFKDESTQWDLPIIPQIESVVTQQEQIVGLDPWDEYRMIFNFDRRRIKQPAKIDMIDTIIKITILDKDSQVDRFELLNAVADCKMKDRYYKTRVSALVTELLCQEIPPDNKIRGIRLKL